MTITDMGVERDAERRGWEVRVVVCGSRGTKVVSFFMDDGTQTLGAARLFSQLGEALRCLSC